MVAAKPYLDANGTVRGGATRAGCDDQARLRVRIVQLRPGPDRTLKSGSKLIGNGSVVAGVRCTDVPRRLYVTATDYRGNQHRSGVVALSCDTAPIPAPPPRPRPPRLLRRPRPPRRLLRVRPQVARPWRRRSSS
ncbi:hypothetical protein [Nonomuraea dietziae]|uniref:hypothetical protein n=1 Tax=Nonomuraea dietziae TaxID=65515 RepID=UPI0031D7DE37